MIVCPALPLYTVSQKMHHLLVAIISSHGDGTNGRIHPHDLVSSTTIIHGVSNNAPPSCGDNFVPWKWNKRQIHARDCASTFLTSKIVAYEQLVMRLCLITGNCWGTWYFVLFLLILSGILR